MSEYNQFVMAVNKIFEITAKLKSGWKDQDNINIADSVEESKTTVVEAAKLFNTKTIPQTQPVNKSDDIALDNDEQVSEEMGVLGE